MQENPDRFEAVTDALDKMLRILEDGDNFEELKKLAKKIDPSIVEESERKRDVPKWYMSLLTTLTKLYDRGYTDSASDTEQLK